MGRRRLSIELDKNLIEAVRTLADRSRLPEEELYERALRDVLEAPDAIARLEST